MEAAVELSKAAGCTTAQASAAASSSSSADGEPARRKTSSSAFETYRVSLRGRHGPLLTQYRSLLSGERGVSGAADLGLGSLGLSRVGDAVESLVQLADLRLQAREQAQKVPSGEDGQDADASLRAGEPELEQAALELFDELCGAVVSLSSGLAAIPPEVYADELRRRWSGSTATVVGNMDAGGCETWAARAAAMFRMKDCVSSLYAWALLPRSTPEKLIEVIRAQRNKDETGAVRIIDPIAGTGLHGSVLHAAGADVVLADVIVGGNTQASAAEGFSQCVSLGPSNSGLAEAGAAKPTSAPLMWHHVEHADVLDESDEATAWWKRNSESADGNTPVLFLSFPPPPPSPVAEIALRRFGGEWLIFVGEWRGCTGSAAFFDALDAGWDICCEVELPRWPMMEDKAVLLRKRRIPAVDTTQPSPETCLIDNLEATPELESWEVDQQRGITLFVPKKAAMTSGADEPTSGPRATGAILWGAARVLIDYLRRVDDATLSRASSVLELGAGSFGLVGAYIRRRLPRSTVMLTDLPHVVARLRENLRFNASPAVETPEKAAPAAELPSGGELTTGGKVASVEGSLMTAALSWEELPTAEVRCHSPYDLIVASDVAFCAPLLPHLFKTLGWLSSHKTVAIIAIVDRPGEAESFENAAAAARWRFERCITHDLDIKGFQGACAEEVRLLQACRDLGGYRILVYELKKVL
eukprot:TRINITY_DN54861_c0_g1_i1.p1 TRINITY_DN54861_c0_g1~~TRINITY_DN54861_c0_g1_i1.p1  ORF type:complete len:755 (+),score=132.09 TRINITY_DN54861_c0_g1_i1:164-2266(+)